MIRKFPGVASTTLSASGVIAISATNNQTELAELKPTLTPEYFAELKTNIETTRQSLVGINKRASLKQATATVQNLIDQAYPLLKRIKVMIEVNFEAESAKECLQTLRYTEYFEGAVKGQQASTIDLLSALSEHIDELKEEFTALSLPTEVIDQATALTPQLIEANNNQELNKNTKSLTNEQVEKINTIYKEIRDICKIAHVIYADDDATKRNYTFSKVVAGLN